MGFGARMKALNTKLITKFGKPELVTFTKIAVDESQADYDPATLSYEEAESETYQLLAAPVNFKTWELANLNIQQGDKRLYVTSDGVRPALGDTVELDSETFRIKDMTVSEAQGVVSGYILTIGK